MEFKAIKLHVNILICKTKVITYEYEVIPLHTCTKYELIPANDTTSVLNICLQLWVKDIPNKPTKV